jgi:hypothetical protein
LETTTRLMETLLRFEAGHKRHDVADMRACFRDDALVESIASHGQALGPGETLEAIDAAFGDGVYEIGNWQYEEISAELVLCSTGARHRVPGTGMRDETVCRLMSGRDGLIWRAKLFRNRDDALEHLEAYGPDLGMSSAPPA